jgi:hypothetical protein
MRDLDSGIEMIADETTKSGLRRTARKIQFAAPWVALIFAAIALWATR